jgi:hypothetical protein
LLGRLLPGTVPFGFMLLLDHVGSHRLDTLALGARLFSFLLDVPILALFFFADPSHMFLLGYRALLARMEHLFRQPRCHTPSSEQSLCQALRHRQPPIGSSILPLLSLPWADLPSRLPPITFPVGVVVRSK